MAFYGTFIIYKMYFVMDINWNIFYYGLTNMQVTKIKKNVPGNKLRNISGFGCMSLPGQINISL